MTFDRARVRDLLDAERRTLAPWGAALELLPDVTRVRGLIVDWHDIAWSALAGADADAVIAREVAHYRQLGVSVEWTVYGHDEPADLRQRLARHG
ncbi:MAG TPA: hypothetical protein VG963_01175, partial [Polyangiaceae bacterium]|nr:hypothetical protein [Polyangiaceae bacterium]